MLQTQGAIQLFLSVVGTREETIFLLRIITHQLFCEVNQVSRSLLRAIYEEMMKGEQRRETLEENATSSISEGIRKYIPKLVQKVSRVSTYYANKTQIYFPRYGQLLAQEQMQFNSNLKASVLILNNDPNYTSQMILKYISNQQKQKLKGELYRLHQYSPQIQQFFDRSDRCNRNEKLFTEPLLSGVQGVRYINDIHNRYFFQTRPRSNRQVYDIMPLDESSKQMMYQGPGFRSFMSTVCQLKTDKSAESIYVPLETSQEIITQRYDKFLKDMQESNYHIAKGLQKYAESYNKFVLRRNSKQSKAQSLQSRASVIKTSMSVKLAHSLSSAALKTEDQMSESIKRDKIVNSNSEFLKPKTLQETKEIFITPQRDVVSQKRLIRVKQPAISNQSSQIVIPQQTGSPNDLRHTVTSPKVQSPEEIRVVGMGRLSIVTLPHHKQPDNQASHRARKLRYAQVSYECERPASRYQTNLGYRYKVGNHLSQGVNGGLLENNYGLMGKQITISQNR